jgi:hypothetical protein
MARQYFFDTSREEFFWQPYEDDDAPALARDAHEGIATLEALAAKRALAGAKGEA